MNNRSARRQAGFTLPELLVVGVVLLVFIAVMLLLLRPTNYDAERRNAIRRISLVHIMNAISAYKNQQGTLPPTITSKETIIGTGEEGVPNLCDDLVPYYLADVPGDPSQSFKAIEDDSCAAQDQFYVSGYAVRIDEGGRVVLSAPAAENKEKITLERWFPIL